MITNTVRFNFMLSGDHIKACAAIMLPPGCCGIEIGEDIFMRHGVCNIINSGHPMTHNLDGNPMVINLQISL